MGITAALAACAAKVGVELIARAGQVVLPLAAIGLIYAEAQANSIPEIQGYLAPEIVTPYLLTFVWLLPYLVLLIAVMRRVRAPTSSPHG